jgi:hypothetical protein
MPDINLKPSQRAGVVGQINPQSATTEQTTSWIDATLFHNYLAIVQVGAMISTGLVDAAIQQATSSGGAGAKAITGKAITEFTQTANPNEQALINIKQEDLDTANGFKWIQLSITPSVEAALIAGTVLGFDPRYGFASDSTNAASSQVQVL